MSTTTVASVDTVLANLEKDALTLDKERSQKAIAAFMDTLPEVSSEACDKCGYSQVNLDTPASRRARVAQAWIRYVFPDPQTPGEFLTLTFCKHHGDEYRDGAGALAVGAVIFDESEGINKAPSVSANK